MKQIAAARFKKLWLAIPDRIGDEVQAPDGMLNLDRCVPLLTRDRRLRALKLVPLA